ncbi:MAG TPA: hypothetical protein PLX71_04655 [Phycicoccus sp.]|nr:hypothetical protein [Phycicoccus sp.]
MYAALWRLLPGPAWVKALQVLVLIVAVVAVCFVWVFPWISPKLPFTQNTVEEGSSISVGPSASLPASPSGTASPSPTASVSP